MHIVKKSSVIIKVNIEFRLTCSTEIMFYDLGFSPGNRFSRNRLFQHLLAEAHTQTCAMGLPAPMSRLVFFSSSCERVNIVYIQLSL